MSIEANIKLLYFFLIAWYAVFLAGTFQFRRLKTKTGKIIIEHTEKLQQNNAEIDPEQVYLSCYSDWCAMVKKNAWFIPGKHELCPIPATLENVKNRVGFSPTFIRDLLERKKFI